MATSYANFPVGERGKGTAGPTWLVAHRPGPHLRNRTRQKSRGRGLIWVNSFQDALSMVRQIHPAICEGTVGSGVPERLPWEVLPFTIQACAPHAKGHAGFWRGGMCVLQGSRTPQALSGLISLERVTITVGAIRGMHTTVCSGSPPLQACLRTEDRNTAEKSLLLSIRTDKVYNLTLLRIPLMITLTADRGVLVMRAGEWK